MIKLYTLADWDSRQPWDDLVGGDTGQIYLTISGKGDLLESLQMEYSLKEEDKDFDDEIYKFEQILSSLEGGDIQVVLSDYDSELLHDIYIPEFCLCKNLINYHVDIFNSMHPELPNFDFTGELPPWWEGVFDKFADLDREMADEGLEEYSKALQKIDDQSTEEEE